MVSMAHYLRLLTVSLSPCLVFGSPLDLPLAGPDFNISTVPSRNISSPIIGNLSTPDAPPPGFAVSIMEIEGQGAGNLERPEAFVALVDAIADMAAGNWNREIGNIVFLDSTFPNTGIEFRGWKGTGEYRAKSIVWTLIQLLDASILRAEDSRYVKFKTTVGPGLDQILGIGKLYAPNRQTSRRRALSAPGDEELDIAAASNTSMTAASELQAAEIDIIFEYKTGGQSYVADFVLIKMSDMLLALGPDDKFSSLGYGISDYDRLRNFMIAIIPINRSVRENLHNWMAVAALKASSRWMWEARSKGKFAEFQATIRYKNRLVGNIFLAKGRPTLEELERSSRL